MIGAFRVAYRALSGASRIREVAQVGQEMNI
jgi:hypothetical protein